jgi:hypothetical protein
MVMLFSPAVAQNTKGDRPAVKSEGKRENRFRISRKKTKSKQPYNRVQGRRPTQANRASASKKSKIYSQK